MKLLFVDDEPNVLRGLSRLLFQYSDEWDMHFSSSGEEALRVLSEDPIDVLVTDMRMPGMDGAKLLEIVHEKHPRVARVVLSGHTELEAALRAMPVAHQFLAKPCPAEALRGVLERAARLHTLVQDPMLQQLVGGLSALPARPKVFFELNRVLAREKIGVRDVARVIGDDVGISATVLHLVNSAFFGASSRIKAVDAAVARLGVNVVKSVVLSAEVARAFQVAPAHADYIDAVTEDSLKVARVAQAIARKLVTHAGAADAVTDVFMSGILHRVGLLVLAAKAPARLLELRRAQESSDESEVELERRIMGTTHPDIGAYLLGLWGLPYDISEAVQFHRLPGALAGQGWSPGAVLALARALVDEVDAPRGAPSAEATVDALQCSADLSDLREIRDHVTRV